MDYVSVNTTFINWVRLGQQINSGSVSYRYKTEYMADFMRGFFDYYHGQCYVFNASMLEETRTMRIRYPKLRASC